MANDPSPELRAELQAVLAMLAPQIRGLHDLAAASISTDLANSVREQTAGRERRRDLINAVLANLDATVTSHNQLEADA